MLVFFCGRCGRLHPSRLRARSEQEWSRMAGHWQPVWERCPRTGDWLHVSATRVVWQSLPLPDGDVPAPERAPV